ncbi:hypothetical protein E5C26_13090 [Serratia proteamaculans]|uniref:hypothetical protein n=1 Tax=Serratia proteamaculans TaxID=28151 RepID=UPI0010769233|nr:hypothetical protein [Serratia proteamaculans]TFZ50679.1 hypothetical protein E5C26_13090 [Serratia proteamaculans]
MNVSLLLKSKGLKPKPKVLLVHNSLTCRAGFGPATQQFRVAGGIGINDNPCTIMGIKNILIVHAGLSFIFVMQINKKIVYASIRNGMLSIFEWTLLFTTIKGFSLKITHRYLPIKESSPLCAFH